MLGSGTGGPGRGRAAVLRGCNPAETGGSSSLPEGLMNSPGVRLCRPLGVALQVLSSAGRSRAGTTPTHPPVVFV